MPEFSSHVAEPFGALKKSYDAGASPLELIKGVSLSAHRLVTREPEHALSDGYIAYGLPESTEGITRPIRSDLFESGTAEFSKLWDSAISSVLNRAVDARAVNRALYTCVQSFAGAFDLLNRSARKTPGTFFEILVGSLLSSRLQGPRYKQVILTVEGESVSIPTDIYFENEHLTVAAKTSSRERIIMPYGHQLLLDRLSAQLGRERFRTIFCLVGEVQLGRDKVSCHPTCVPRQVALYQKHVAQLEGLFYLDPPEAYRSLDRQGLMRVSTIGDLLSEPLSILDQG